MPWDGLGVSVYGSRQEVLRRASLDWQVEKQPVFVLVGDKRVAVPDRSALVRRSDGYPLSVVSSDWQPIQNDGTLELFEQMAGLVGGRLRWFGSLRQGQLVWGIVALGIAFDLAGRRVDACVLLSSSHAYGKSTDAQYLALLSHPAATYVEKLNIVRVSHRSDFDERALVGLREKVANRHALLQRDFARLAEAPAGNYDATYSMVMRAVRPSAVMSQTYKTELNGRTLLDVLHAGARAIDTRLGVSDDTRLASAWYGVNRTRKMRLLENVREELTSS